jgi:HSP20 family protein
MALTLFKRRRPFEGLTTSNDEFDNFFDDNFTTENIRSTWYPAVDIEHKEKEYVLKADLPGLKKEDIKVTIENGYLTLKGERKTEHEENKNNYHRIERTYGTFQRSFKISEGLTEKQIKATYHDGVLELTIPTPKVEEPKSIDVKVE